MTKDSQARLIPNDAYKQVKLRGDTYKWLYSHREGDSFDATIKRLIKEHEEKGKPYSQV